MPKVRCDATYRKDWAVFRLTVLEAGYVTTKGKACAGEPYVSPSLARSLASA